MMKENHFSRHPEICPGNQNHSVYLSVSVSCLQFFPKAQNNYGFFFALQAHIQKMW